MFRAALSSQQGEHDVYPLVNVQKTMEHHHFQWENSLFLWLFSSSQTVNVYQRVWNIGEIMEGTMIDLTSSDL